MNLQKGLLESNYNVEYANVESIAKMPIGVDDELKERVEQLLEKMEIEEECEGAFAYCL